MAILNKGFVHTVFFWLKEKDNTQHLNELEAGLHKLSTISEIKQAFVGKPAGTNREVIDGSYSISLTFIFANKEDQDVYQDHAEHHQFINECSKLWSTVKVYDAC
jgi:Stress responsive A/B Barrel Domain